MQHIAENERLEPRWLEMVLGREMLSCFGGFIQGLIHNINGPLQNISMLTELMQTGFVRMSRLPGGDGDPHGDERSRLLEREQQRLQKLAEQVATMDSILRELRLLHEIERTPGEIDLNLLVLNLVQTFHCDLFFKHQVQLELKLANNLPRIPVLARHLIPSLIHLFRNAMTAMREAPQKRLVIESRTAEKSICLSIKDTGCGLKPDEAERCFEPFYSGWPPSLQNQEIHYGVGLFLVSTFLRPHAITVALRPEEQGTTACLEFPAKSGG